MKISIRVHALFESLFPVLLSFALLITSPNKSIILFRSKFSRCDILLVLPERVPAHGPIEDLNWLQAEARADLDQGQLLNVILLCEFLLMLIYDLVGSEPDTVVVVVEGKDVVDEGFGFWVVLWRVEGLMQHFFH